MGYFLSSGRLAFNAGYMTNEALAMKRSDFNFISLDADPEQRQAILHRRAAGAAGPVCTARHANDHVDPNNVKVRFRSVGCFLRALRDLVSRVGN
jgi:hypothetical protein